MSAIPSAPSQSASRPDGPSKADSSKSDSPKPDSRADPPGGKDAGPQQMAEKPSPTEKPGATKKDEDEKKAHGSKETKDAGNSPKAAGQDQHAKSAPSPLASSALPKESVKAPSVQPAPPPQAPPPPPAPQVQQVASPPSAVVQDDKAAPTPLSASPLPTVVPLQACKKPTDCPSKICMSGICAVSSGFAVQTIPSGQSAASASSISGNYPASRPKGPSTACSDPRCHLSPYLKGLNDPEGDLPPAGSSNAKLLSDAGIAGLVLALLFVVLFLLLVVPKVRALLREKLADWRNTKDASNAKRKLGDGTPDFGNEDASTFEKRNAKYASSFVSPGHISGSPLPSQQYAQYFSQQQEQQQEYTLEYQPREAGPHEIVYMGGEKTGEKSSKGRAVSFAGPGARRKAISFAADLQTPTKANLPSSATDGAINSRRAPRETVLPYTVGFEDDTDALAGLRGIASPLIQNSAK